MGTTYISIQPIDYDDYPLGLDMKVGPFDSKEECEAWMEESGRFERTYGGWGWKSRDHVRRHTVTVKDLMDTHMMSPKDYLTRGRR